MARRPKSNLWSSVSRSRDAMRQSRGPAVAKSLAAVSAFALIAAQGFAHGGFAPTLGGEPEVISVSAGYADDQSASVAPDQVEDRRLDSQVRMARAQSLIGLGRSEEARAEARAVLAADPLNVDAMRLLATADEMEGRNREASQIWGTVYKITGDPAAQERMRALRGASQSSLGGRILYFGSPDAGDENYGLRLDATGMIRSVPGFDAALEARHIENDGITYLDGRSGSASKTASRLDLGYRHDVNRAFAVGGEANVLENGLGGRVFMRGRNKSSTVELSVGQGQPYWLFAEGVANDARESHVGLSASGSAGWLAARGDVRKIRYDVDGDREVGKATRVTVGVDLFNPKAVRPVRVAYVIDAENIDSTRDFVAPGGGAYQPLPLVSREVHSLGVYKAVRPTTPLTVDFGAGYRIDRKGDEGPFASINGAVKLGESTEANALVEYSKPSIRGQGASGNYIYSQVALRRRY